MVRAAQRRLDLRCVEGGGQRVGVLEAMEDAHRPLPPGADFARQIHADGDQRDERQNLAVRPAAGGRGLVVDEPRSDRQAELQG